MLVRTCLPNIQQMLLSLVQTGVIRISKQSDAPLLAGLSIRIVVSLPEGERLYLNTFGERVIYVRISIINMILSRLKLVNLRTQTDTNRTSDLCPQLACPNYGVAQRICKTLFCHHNKSLQRILLQIIRK